MVSAMPNRARSHILEEESKREFLKLIPAAWVAHEPARDYGVDFRVEIFEGGIATGLHFNVQLKATSAARPRIRVKRATKNYWNALGDLTLVAVWNSSSARFSFCWSHQIDNFAVDPQSSQIAVRPLLPWGSTTVPEILSEVRGARASRLLTQHLPVVVKVDAEQNEERQRALVALLRASLSSVRDITLDPAKSRDARCEISVRNNQMTVRLIGEAGAILHFGTDLEDYPTEGLAADILVAFALQLDGRGLDRMAAELISLSVDHSAMVLAAGRIGSAVRLVALDGRMDAVARLLERTFPLNGEAHSSAVATLIRQRDRIAMSDRVNLAQKLTQMGSGDSEFAAATFFNASQLVKGDHALALQYLADATDRLPDYQARGYWWRERGGIYFLDGQYAEAADSYQRAVELGDDHSLGLYADALLHSGHYEEAVRVWSEERAIRDPQWRLSGWAFGHVASMIKIDRQSRQPRDAVSLLTSSDTDNYDHIEEVLNLDLLCHDALLALANILRLQGRDPVPFRVAAALSEPYSVPTWVSSMLSIIRLGEDGLELLADVVETSKQLCGERLRGFLLAEPFAPIAVRDFLLSMWDHAPSAAPEPFVLRMNGEVIGVQLENG